MLHSQSLVGTFAVQDPPRILVEQSRHDRLAFTLFDPRYAGPDRARVAERMDVGGNRVAEIVLYQESCGRALSLTVCPIERAEIDEQRRAATDGFVPLALDPQGSVALGMRQD